MWVIWSNIEIQEIFIEEIINKLRTIYYVIFPEMLWQKETRVFDANERV